MNFCPKCGFPTENMKFCPKCGFELKKPVPTESKKDDTKSIPVEVVEKAVDSDYKITGQQGRQTSEDELRTLRAALVGEKADHYVPIFEDLDKNGGQSWNWCGCLFSPMWFTYRKLYGWAAIALLAPLVFGVLLGIMLVSAPVNYTDAALKTMSKGIGFICAIVFGILSNKAYKKRIDKLIREMPSDEIAKNQFIKSKGGVSAGGLIIAIIITLALNFGSALL